MACAAIALAMSSCRIGDDTGTGIRENYKTLTTASANMLSEADGLRRYTVQLSGPVQNTGSVYGKSAVTLSLELVTAAEGDASAIAGGEYTVAAEAAAGTIVASGSYLSVSNDTSYGGNRSALSEGSVSVASFNGKYEFSGTVLDQSGRTLEFDFYGTMPVNTIGEPSQPEQESIDFEDAELSSSTGGYADILWGLEQATETDGVPTYSGLLYTSGRASFGSYYTESYGMGLWGGFAVSSNRDLEDLGMDYSNQFSVYAPEAGQFAIGYVYGEWGGEWATPTIVFSEPVTMVSASIANANKTYHYCMANQQVGPDGATEPIWVDLVITGYDADGAELSRITVRLADGADVLANWQTFDLSALGAVSRAVFTIESNDTGDYGLNVPAYFCIDDIILQ